MSRILRPIHLGLDVHQRHDLGRGPVPGSSPRVDKIANDEASVRRLVARFADPGRLRACYEAGPTGFELARLLHRMGVSCQVIAPSLIPKAPGDRVKTDKRDCRRLARLHRAGELVAIRIPTPAEEAVRDLCRARADMVEDRMRARHRLSKFLLRHGRVWRDGKAWTLDHERWLLSPTLRRASAAVDLRPLPGGAEPRRAAGRDRGRPGRLAGPRPRSPSRWPAWPPTGA